MTTRFTGVIPPMITPLTADEGLDRPAIRPLRTVVAGEFWAEIERSAERALELPLLQGPVAVADQREREMP
ncbi:MAG: hypothetical protein M1380_04575 [Chloroflexi bacterium]|nr:hypothetical protein [Chloroflexota bacterium]